MNKQTIIDYMKTAAGAVKEAADLFAAQPEFATALRITGGLLDIAVTLLEQGVNPVEHITRLVDLDAQMNQIRTEVDADAHADKPAGS